MQTFSHLKSIAHALQSRRSLALILFVALAGGCTESTEPAAPAIEVRVVTSGAAADVDPDGYSLLLGTSTFAIPANGTLAIPDFAPGVHRITLAGVAANCANANVQLATVTLPLDRQNGTVRVLISVTCSPNLGAVRITTETSGPDPDQNGYTLSLRGKDGTATSIILKTNGLAEGRFRPGEAEVSLEGIAANCRLADQQRTTIVVEHAKFLELSVQVVCVANGSITVTAQTPGDYPDADGYLAMVLRDKSSIAAQPVKTNGAVTLSGLAPGNYELRLTGVEIHCDVPQSVVATVRSAETTNVTFDVSCITPFEIAYVAWTGNEANIAAVTTDGRLGRVVLSEAGQELDPAWSPDGRRIAFTKARAFDEKIGVVNADGTNRVELTSGRGRDLRPDWSPDGGRIAFVREIDANSDIYVMSADGSNQTRLTDDAAVDTDPAWSPDGTRIAFARSASIYVMNADGSEVTRLTTGSVDRQPAWSPDGTLIAFASHNADGSMSINVMELSGDKKVAAVVSRLHLAADPAWSPDGKAIAFEGASEDCYYYCGLEIHFVRLDGFLTTPVRAIGGASSPTWRPRP